MQEQPTFRPHYFVTTIRDRMMIQFIRNKAIFSTEDHWVYKSNDNGLTWSKVCKLEVPSPSIKARLKDLSLRSFPARYLRRNIGIHNLVVLPKTGTILLQYDGIYRFDGTERVAKKVYDFAKEGIIGPLTNGFVVDDTTGNVYWGEYSIKRPHSVRIIKGSMDGTQWGECFRFPSGRIRHVHSIIPDYYRKRIWICTGDSDREAGLFYTEDDFNSVELFRGGDQSWRVVSLIPTEDSIYWGSDAGGDAPPDALNYIYKWDFRHQKRERIQLIDKPAYYSTLLSSGLMCISVHHEPKIKRRVEASSDLWISSNGESWERILKMPFLPANRKKGTKYASIILPLGDASLKDLFFTPLNVREYDFCLRKMEFKK